MTSAERPRRWRRTPALRRLARETRLHPAELIAPLFVEAGTGVAHAPRRRCPGSSRLSPDTVGEEARRLEALGVGGVILFGDPRDEGRPRARSGWDPDGPRAARAAARSRAAAPGPRAHGRRVPVRVHGPRATAACSTRRRRRQRRDAAAARARGRRVRARRRRRRRAERHDGRAGRRDPRGRSTPRASPTTPILAYAAKTASAFYGPFRDAAGSTPGPRRPQGLPDGPRATATRRCARCASTSSEGADAVMVKPAGPNLDLIRDVADDGRRARGRLPGERRVRDAPRRRRAGLARPRPRGVRVAARHPARRARGGSSRTSRRTRREALARGPVGPWLARRRRTGDPAGRGAGPRSRALNGVARGLFPGGVSARCARSARSAASRP